MYASLVPTAVPTNRLLTTVSSTKSSSRHSFKSSYSLRPSNIYLPEASSMSNTDVPDNKNQAAEQGPGSLKAQLYVHTNKLFLWHISSEEKQKTTLSVSISVSWLNLPHYIILLVIIFQRMCHISDVNYLVNDIRDCSHITLRETKSFCSLFEHKHKKTLLSPFFFLL